ncbi:MAG TPA: cytochrome P460 family protein [Kaistia sp.]|nr:cytochrome P460 family protein [Kaistia sp.]
MKPLAFPTTVVFILAPMAMGAGIENDPTAEAPSSSDLSPIYGVAIPSGYRHWEFVAPATEEAPLDELRAVLGNPAAIASSRADAPRFPDGTVFVKLAWKRKQSPDFDPATVPGAATTVQVMVKDSKRFPSTGGWGFGRFIDGEPVDWAQHETCWACHQARASDHDFVFTRYAP